MGDLVLLEAEINPVMTRLIEGGLQITCSPQSPAARESGYVYLHVGGHGDPVRMATAIHNALAASKTPLSISQATTSASTIDLDTAQIDRIIGAKGHVNGGIYQIGVARRDQITMDGVQVSPAGPTA